MVESVTCPISTPTDGLRSLIKLRGSTLKINQVRYKTSLNYLLEEEERESCA